MNRFVRCLSLTVTLVALMIPATGSAQNANLQTDLSGFEEAQNANATTGTPAIAAIFSTGNGQLTLKLNTQARQIAYELTYQFPNATTPVAPSTQFVNQAHLHFGQRYNAGSITVWLCQSTDSPAPSAVASITPNCPSPSGTVSGTIKPANVLAVAAQGFPGGEPGFDALLAAIGSETIYVNVHTDRFTGGEIRGQVGDHPPH
jgi:hypothetical protein